MSARDATDADESGAAEADGAVSVSEVAITKGSVAATDWATGSTVPAGAASSKVASWELDATGLSRGEGEGFCSGGPPGSAESPVAASSARVSNTSMGGGLRAFDLRRGEGGRGHQPARQHRRQPEAQKRPRSLPVHSGSPSLVDVELRRIYRFRPRSATMSHPLNGATRQVLTFAMRSGRRRPGRFRPFRAGYALPQRFARSAAWQSHSRHWDANGAKASPVNLRTNSMRRKLFFALSLRRDCYSLQL